MQHPELDRPLRAVLAEDSGLFRDSVERSLAELGIELVASFDHADRLVALANPGLFDLAIVDVYYDGEPAGLRAAAALSEKIPGVHIMLLSDYTAPLQTLELLQTFGSIGYLRKFTVSDTADLENCITRLMRGEAVVDQSVVRALMQKPKLDPALSQLKPKERAVLELMAQGYSNQGIAERLCLSIRTIEERVGDLMRALNESTDPDWNHSQLNRRTLAVLYWFRSTGNPLPDTPTNSPEHVIDVTAAQSRNHQKSSSKRP